MKRAIIAASVCLCISSSHALAVDWSLYASLTEAAELHDNQFLRTMLAAGTLASYTTVAAKAVAATPTSRFVLDTDIRYSKFLGPGAEGLPLTESTANSVNAHYETFGKNPSDRQYVDASWGRQSTALAVLSELGILTPTTGDINNVGLRGGIERDLSARDFATLAVRSSLSYYDPSSAGIQFLNTAGTATWKHRLDGRTSLRASSEVEWLSYDNAAKNNILIFRNLAGLDLALSPLLDFRGSAGVARIQSSQSSTTSSAIAPPLVTGPLASGSGSALGFIGDMTINYRLLKTTTLSFTASQSVAPTVVGSLIQNTSIGAGLAYTINQLSTLSFSGSVSRLTGQGSSDFLSLSAGYNRLLTRNWNANVSYRYLRRSGTSGGPGVVDPIAGFPLVAGLGPASDNSISLVVSRNFTVLPPGN